MRRTSLPSSVCKVMQAWGAPAPPRRKVASGPSIRKTGDSIIPLNHGLVPNMASPSSVMLLAFRALFLGSLQLPNQPSTRCQPCLPSSKLNSRARASESRKTRHNKHIRRFIIFEYTKYGPCLQCLSRKFLHRAQIAGHIEKTGVSLLNAILELRYQYSVLYALHRLMHV